MAISKFKTWFAATTVVALTASMAVAQAPEKLALEKKAVTLGVGGASLLYYLPLTLADKLGYFKEQGLEVEINDFKGGSQSLQALVGGSIDVVAGAYEHTLRMQAKNQDILAVIEMGRYPAISLAIKKDRADKIKSAADLKGAKIGVTAPGSSTNMMVWYLMAKAGLKPDDASFVAVGTGAAAVAAIQKGEIDAIANLDPVIAKLESTGDVVVLAETRTTAGNTKVLGGPMPAGVIYLKREFMEKNPNTTQALVNAIYKTLVWMQAATPEKIAEAVPADYHLGDKALYITALKAVREAYSQDGVITSEGIKRAMEFLQQFDKDMQASKIDTAKTWDGRFVAKAAQTVK
jgi:NitT/TauT family transport system substrate-binding protein